MTATDTCPHEEAVWVGSPKKELHSVMPKLRGRDNKLTRGIDETILSIEFDE